MEIYEIDNNMIRVLELTARATEFKEDMKAAKKMDRRTLQSEYGYTSKANLIRQFQAKIEQIEFEIERDKKKLKTVEIKKPPVINFNHLALLMGTN
jgi:hypothetical protein